MPRCGADGKYPDANRQRDRDDAADGHTDPQLHGDRAANQHGARDRNHDTCAPDANPVAHTDAHAHGCRTLGFAHAHAEIVVDAVALAVAGDRALSFRRN